MTLHDYDISSTRLFERALSVARIKRFYARIFHRCRQLLRLADIYRNAVLVHEQRVGIQSVPVNQIGGSVNKDSDFDIDFYPLKSYSENRWGRVARAVRAGAAMPPVELIRLCDLYYVIDGHHRVSVARMLKQDYVDAEVTEIGVASRTPDDPTPVCLTNTKFLNRHVS